MAPQEGEQMTNHDVIQQTDDYILGTYKRFPVALESGENATLKDFDGKTYIDFASGIGVCSLGCGNEAWLAAITQQAKKLPHVSNLYYTEPAATAAKTLVERTGMQGVFFSNSGAEANEGAIKLARKYSFDKYGAGRNQIITLHHSFHGRTITTLAATGQDVFHQYFFPFTDGFIHAEPNDVACVKSACMSGTVCAVMMELIQGEGGVLPLDEAYAKQVQELCQEALRAVRLVALRLGETSGRGGGDRQPFFVDPGLQTGNIAACGEEAVVAVAAGRLDRPGSSPACGSAEDPETVLHHPGIGRSHIDRGGRHGGIEPRHSPAGQDADRGAGGCHGGGRQGDRLAFVPRDREETHTDEQFQHQPRPRRQAGQAEPHRRLPGRHEHHGDPG